MRSMMIAVCVALLATMAQGIVLPRDLMNLGATKVPVCSGASNSSDLVGASTNCWKQTVNNGVTIDDESVSSSTFPCSGADTATTFTLTSTVTLDDTVACTIDTKGFGAPGKKTLPFCAPSSTNASHVGADPEVWFGCKCPSAAGSGIVCQGPTLKCEKGFGSYDITIECQKDGTQLFSILTKVTY